MFTLEYGNFEDEINLFDYSQVGNISTSFAMRDGFFYIANSESGKVMELSSYGDLLTLYYSEEMNPTPSFATENGEELNATRRAISYPFNSTSDVAIDSKKNLYVVDRLPVERQEMDDEIGEYVNQVVLGAGLAVHAGGLQRDRAQRKPGGRVRGPHRHLSCQAQRP